MKIFAELYIGILAILVFVLIVSGVLMVNATFDMNIDREVTSGTERHDIFQNVFQNNLIITTKNEQADEAAVQKAVKLSKGSDSLPVTVIMNDLVAYSDETPLASDTPPKEGVIAYRKYEKNNKTYLEFRSIFKKRNITYTCVTMSDITGVIEENNELRGEFRLIYLVVLILGTLFALWFSIRITRPIRKLSVASLAIANGDYSKRIEKVTRDELGTLTESYNMMADTIEEKIDALELSVKQKEDFIAAFAHETKTPMTSIIGYADLLYQGKLKGADQREAAEVIMNEGQRLQALSLKLLDMIALDRTSLETEMIGAADMLEDIATTAKQSLSFSGVDFTYEAEDEYLRVDYDLFKTVILNLIDNAIKAKATRISITGQKESEDFYAFVAEDNGVGIPEDKLSRVKEAFYMVDKSRSRQKHGAGLGLALCDRIIALHDGRMDIFSKEGNGTQVKIILPVTQK
ncbi:MAG: HAMP domain-containing sensor histidine kinase [Eubacterium sp.]|nr:HAMP domain-containing sensor histidine kinase [Eubacterium sp.]